MILLSKRYNNYHRHDHYSNSRTPDCIVKPEHYIERIKELGHTNYFTTNHGCSGDVFEAYDLCKKNNLNCIFGMEMYYADDRLNKESRKNYHIVVIGLTKNAYRHINRISSEANKTGFYYHPRVDMELLLTLPRKEVVITTACLGGRLFKTDDYLEAFVLPLKEYFGDHFLLETQNHLDRDQAMWNKAILKLSEEYGIPIIHGNDSHYIYPEDSKDRDDFIKGRGMNYGSEDNFVLDYPSYDEVIQRYLNQGILSKEQAIESLDNTLIFDNAEDLDFTKESKMPDVHGDKDKNSQLKSIIVDKWHDIKPSIPKSRHDEYIGEIGREVDIIERTDTADYFLLNEKIIDRAVNVYDAVLTRTGRGSSPSFFINHVLGFTDIDRIGAKVPLYPTRFMTVARILESGQMPDIDFNFADVEPVIRASKDILGEDGVYYMVAYGTMQESGAFRNLCRARNIDPSLYNDIAKNIDEYRDSDEWGELIEESKKFIGVIDSIAPSPCAFIILDKPISKEIGLTRVGDVMCASINGDRAEEWGYLKNDYLTVDVWKIISDTFEMIEQPIPSIKEIEGMIGDNVWKLYEDGITATLNQVDSKFATDLMMKYKATSIEELSAFVAAIRPGFASLLDNFLERKPYTTQVEELDEILEDSFHYLLYQESIMRMLIWCGIPEHQSYDVIKKISRKIFDEDELEALKGSLLNGFIEQTGTEYGFYDVWQVVEDAVRYSFNASHSLSVAYDSIYGAYLKANHPFEYYTVVLNHYEKNIDKTSNISSELNYFNINLKSIKFGYSGAHYRFDKEVSSIFKGVASIKFLNATVGEELFELSQKNTYTSFIQLLKDIKSKTSTGSRQLRILTELGFFSEFGGNQKLLTFIKYFNFLNGRKQLGISKVHDNKYDTVRTEDKDGKIVNKDIHLPLEEYESYFLNNSRQTAKTYMDLDIDAILLKIWNSIDDKVIPLKQQLESEVENLGYIETVIPTASDNLYFVSHYKCYKNKSKPYVTLYNIQDGSYFRTRVDKPRFYDTEPFDLHSVIRVNSFITKPRFKVVDGKFIQTGETQENLDVWKVMQK